MAVEFAGRKAPYAPLSSLREFFGRMREVGVPARVDRRFLQRLNIASSNEWALLSALKFLGVVDDQGVPTNEYRLLQNTDRFKETLQHLVLSAYKPLIDDGGLTMSVDELRNYFRVASSPSQAKNAARFFQEICELAGLEAESRAEAAAESRQELEPPVQKQVQEHALTTEGARLLEAKIALLEKLPAPRQEWAAEEYRAICDAFLAMLHSLDALQHSSG